MNFEFNRAPIPHPVRRMQFCEAPFLFFFFVLLCQKKGSVNIDAKHTLHISTLSHVIFNSTTIYTWKPKMFNSVMFKIAGNGESEFIMEFKMKRTLCLKGMRIK